MKAKEAVTPYLHTAKEAVTPYVLAARERVEPVVGPYYAQAVAQAPIYAAQAKEAKFPGTPIIEHQSKGVIGAIHIN